MSAIHLEDVHSSELDLYVLVLAYAFSSMLMISVRLACTSCSVTMPRFTSSCSYCVNAVGCLLILAYITGCEENHGVKG